MVSACNEKGFPNDVSTERDSSLTRHPAAALELREEDYLPDIPGDRQAGADPALRRAAAADTTIAAYSLFANPE